METWTTPNILWDLWRTGHQPARAIITRQKSRLAELVSFARRRSRFYADHYGNLPVSVSDVRQLPPVTKRELMSHFNEWVTDREVRLDGVEAFLADKATIGHLYLGRYLVWTTSGTTGEPAILLQDQMALKALASLGFTRGLLAWANLPNLWKLIRGGGRSAVLVVTDGHYAAYSLVERELLAHSWSRRATRVLSVLSPISEIVAGLNTFQPVILGGYATAMALLAQEQTAGRLRIHPAFVVTTAEWLTSSERDKIELAFDCRVWSSYGASEAGVIAFECPNRWLHVNEDWIILEPVDRNFQPVMAGQPSQTVLITNLANRVQPIIRYDLGDSVTVKPEPCSCGSSLLAIRVEGRTDDILSFSMTGGKAARVLPLAISTLVEETPGIHSYQLIQTAPTQLNVRLEAKTAGDRDRVWQELKQNLDRYLERQGVTTVSVELADEPPARDPRTGKFRHVWATCVPAG